MIAWLYKLRYKEENYIEVKHLYPKESFSSLTFYWVKSWGRYKETMTIDKIYLDHINYDYEKRLKTLFKEKLEDVRNKIKAELLKEEKFANVIPTLIGKYTLEKSTRKKKTTKTET